MQPFELTPSIAPAQSVVMTEKPAYCLDRTSGRFLPASDAAHAECRRWNT